MFDVDFSGLYTFIAILFLSGFCIVFFVSDHFLRKNNEKNRFNLIISIILGFLGGVLFITAFFAWMGYEAKVEEGKRTDFIERMSDFYAINYISNMGDGKFEFSIKVPTTTEYRYDIYGYKRNHRGITPASYDNYDRIVEVHENHKQMDKGENRIQVQTIANKNANKEDEIYFTYIIRLQEGTEGINFYPETKNIAPVFGCLSDIYGVPCQTNSLLHIKP